MSDQIQLRLEEVLLLLPCPVSGCWARPVPRRRITTTRTAKATSWRSAKTFEEPDDHQGNGDDQANGDLLFGLAAFDFMELVKTVPLETFHFSQELAIFEIGWKEDGQDLELRIHLVPEEAGEES